MSGPLQIGHIAPPIKRELEIPADVDWDLVEDPNLREVLRESSRRRDLFFKEIWDHLADGINWAGATRADANGLLYRYHTNDDQFGLPVNKWLSFSREVWWAAHDAPAANQYLYLIDNMVGAFNHGFFFPQDATIIRWWGVWQPAPAPAANALLKFWIIRNGAAVDAWTALGGEYNFSRDIWKDLNQGDAATIYVTTNSAGILNCLIGIEVAWRTTFPA
jgi:hypothetical protein